MANFGIIYKVTNVINGKIYIGQTIRDLKIRKTQHINTALANRDNNYFHNAISKYGKNSFRWKMIEYCDSKEELDEMEFHYIKQFNSFEFGYNLTLGGGGMSGYKITEKHRENLSKSHIGYKHTKKQRKKISRALTGRSCSAETRSKLSISKLGDKNPMYGRTGSKNSMYGKSLPEHIQAAKVAAVSEEYIVTFPNGTKKKIKNLAKFCRRYNLNKGNLCSVAHGRRRHHKGYTCKKITQGDSNEY